MRSVRRDFHFHADNKSQNTVNFGKWNDHKTQIGLSSLTGYLEQNYANKGDLAQLFIDEFGYAPRINISMYVNVNPIK